MTGKPELTEGQKIWRELVYQVRMLVAEFLLRLAFKALPKLQLPESLWKSWMALIVEHHYDMRRRAHLHDPR